MIARRTFLAGAGLSLLACDATRGCEDGGTSPTGPSEPIPDEPGIPAPRAGSPIGYSNVGSLNAAEARAITAAGATFLALECTPFNQPVPPLDTILTRIEGVAGVARATGATLMVIAVNANSPAQRALGTAWWEPFMAGLTHIGTMNLWFQPITEPGPAQVARMRWALDRWPGVTVGNGIGGRGPSPVPAERLDWHYCSYADLLAGVQTRGDRIHSTDCSPILASSLPAGQIIEVVRAAARLNRTLLLYDTFRPAANPAVLTALRTALT